MSFSSSSSSSPPPRETRGNAAVMIAGKEALKTGIICTCLFTGIHYGGNKFFISQYKAIPPHLKRIIAAVGTLGTVWFQANAAYATAVTDWHQQDAHILYTNDEKDRVQKQMAAVRLVQQQRQANNK